MLKNITLRVPTLTFIHGDIWIGSQSVDLVSIDVWALEVNLTRLKHLLLGRRPRPWKSDHYLCGIGCPSSSPPI